MVRAAEEARINMEQLGLFKKVQIFIDTSKGRFLIPSHVFSFDRDFVLHILNDLFKTITMVPWHSWIAGPWAWTLDPENAGLWTNISIQKHKKIAAIYLTLDSCVYKA